MAQWKELAVEASFPLTLFVNPKELLGDFDSDSVSALIAAAGDIVLVIGRDGIVRNTALHGDELARELGDSGSWVGHLWNSCVVSDSRQKADTMLQEAIDRKSPRWVHVNHPSKRGADIPILYTALQIGDAGHIVAIGRDLRANSVLQQRLVDAQQAMERDYLRLRHVETRYRLLFQMSSEALLVVDPTTQKTLEINPAAGALLGGPVSGGAGRQLLGHMFTSFFDSETGPGVASLLALVRTAGRAEQVTAKAADDGREMLVSASLFRQDNDSLVLVRLLPAAPDVSGSSLSNAKAALLKVIDGAPDGFVLTTADGRIQATNGAFRDMAQLATEEQARAGSLEQWLGRPGVDMNVMTATLRQRGSVSLFATTLRGEYGSNAEVEISAVSVMNGAEIYYGFVIRSVGRRIASDSRIGYEMPRSVDQLTELIGRVPLKELVREATDMIERLCIQAALELTGDNRASAAELLGLSRQSLYVKLRRHGLGDLGGEDDS